MRRAPLLALASLFATPLFPQQAHEIPLPTSKAISSAAPGAPLPLNTFPNEIAVSPDSRYIAILNNGYGSEESQYRQSIAVLNVATNELTDFADPHFGQDAPQTYFAGLAFSLDGKHLYASVASLTDPEAKKPGALGNGIAVYAFIDGELAEDRFIKLQNVELSAGQQFVYDAEHIESNFANSYPAGLAVFQVAGAERLLVASNLSDSVLMLDPRKGTVLSRYDLRRKHGVVPARFPYRVVVAKDGQSGWCALWNDSAVVKLNLNRQNATDVKRVQLDSNPVHDRTGSHPNAVALTPDGRYLFVALSTRDAVAILDAHSGKRIGEISTKLPGQQYEGAYPDALAFTADGKSLFVTDASADAVIKYDVPAQLSASKLPAVSAYIPTEWYPTSLAVVGNDLFVASGKGKGSGPNRAVVSGERGHPYIASLTRGSLARIPLATIAQHAGEFKQEVLEENRMNGRTSEFTFAGGKNPIKHVIYIIKENRTFDQILGDLGVGDGDSSLTMFGADITPNQHALARQFGVLDNFYDSGEVSGDGHVWSTAAITNEYNELTWPIAYRGKERTYDFEGKVGDIYPIDHDEDDINEPGTGYLWTNAAKHHLSYRHYGEYIDTQWCAVHTQNSPASTGTWGSTNAKCTMPQIRPGESLPSSVGDPKGGPSPYGWPIPVLYDNHATKRELRGHFDPKFADFRVDYPDQLRADEFLNEFDGFVRARQSGKGEQLPSFVLLRLPNDHTGGTTPGMPTPQASVADNDLAVGRVVDAISHSPYWDDTAIFILEDDAQDGADHIDAHRSIALVISKYSPRQPKPFVDHHFYTTVNVIHTMEALLGLPPMNNNDAQAALMSALFTGDGSQPAYSGDYRNRDNRLIYQANQPGAYGAKESATMDFSREDRINPQVLNRILWRVTKGDIPMPDPKHTVPLR